MNTLSFIAIWFHKQRTKRERLLIGEDQPPSPELLRKQKIAATLVLLFLILAGVSADWFFFLVGAYATMSQVLCGFQLVFGGTFIIESALFGGLCGHFNCPRPDTTSPMNWAQVIYISGVGALVYFGSSVFSAWKLWQTFSQD